MYRTLEELAQAEATRPELAQPLATFAHAMPVAANVRAHLIRMGTADSLTLGAFLGRTDLHRRLKTIIPLLALTHAVHEVLAGRVAKTPAPQTPAAPEVTAVRDEQVKPNPRSKVVVTGEVIRVVVDPLETGAMLTPGQGAQTAVHVQGAVRRFGHRAFEHELENAQRLVKSLGLSPSREFSWPMRAHLAVVAALSSERELSVTWLDHAPRFHQAGDRSMLRVHATERHGWFELDGGLSVGEVHMSLPHLLAAKQPWVEAAPNEFVLLGDEL
jgi:hypothetical protein